MIENISPTEAWRRLQADPQAQLVDVRTDAEWTFVGLPDLDAAGKRPVLIPWQVYPTMQPNPEFIGHLRRAGLTADSQILFLCRSGARSMAAAFAAVAAGFPHAANIADGFEGNPDGEGHRGVAAGWKAEGLPWMQR